MNCTKKFRLHPQELDLALWLSVPVRVAPGQGFGRTGGVVYASQGA